MKSGKRSINSVSFFCPDVFAFLVFLRLSASRSFGLSAPGFNDSQVYRCRGTIRTMQFGQRVIRYVSILAAMTALCLIGLSATRFTSPPASASAATTKGVPEPDQHGPVVDGPELWIRHCTTSKGTPYIACELTNHSQQSIFFQWTRPSKSAHRRGAMDSLRIAYFGRAANYASAFAEQVAAHPDITVAELSRLIAETGGRNSD